MVVAVCEYQQIDDGTAWEIGYARAKGKKIFALRTDERVVKRDEKINLMIAQSLDRLYSDVKRLVRRLGSRPGRTGRRPRRLRARRASGVRVT